MYGQDSIMGNFGMFSGRMARRAKAFLNKNGSRKYKFTLLRDKGTGKNKRTIAIPFEYYCLAGNKCPLDYLDKGDLVNVLFNLDQMMYTNSEGEKVDSGIIVNATNIDFGEPKSVTDARHKRLAEQAAKNNDDGSNDGEPEFELMPIDNVDTEDETEETEPEMLPIIQEPDDEPEFDLTDEPSL